MQVLWGGGLGCVLKKDKQCDTCTVFTLKPVALREKHTGMLIRCMFTDPL